MGANAAEAAALVTQAICGIRCNPLKSWSCTVTGIQAGGSVYNIIPDRAVLKLDLRAQTNEIMDELLEKLRRAVENTAASMGAKAKVVVPGIVIPAAVYDEDFVADVAQTIRETLGNDKLAHDCGGGGEDFHFFKKLRPSIRAAYFGVGAGCTPGLHARNMTFDPQHLQMGVDVLTAQTLKILG